MKSIVLTLFFLLGTVVMTAQMKLDTLVFNKVNEYRASMGISEMKWDTTAFKASDLHTSYLVRTGKVGHKEDTLVDPKDRLRYFDKVGKWTVINEVALSTNMNISGSDSIYEKLAILIVEGWKKSKLHNEAILDEKCKFAGVKCFVKARPQGLKGVTNYQVVATMVLVGGIYRKL